MLDMLGKGGTKPTPNLYILRLMSEMACLGLAMTDLVAAGVIKGFPGCGFKRNAVLSWWL